MTQWKNVLPILENQVMAGNKTATKAAQEAFLFYENKMTNNEKR